MELIFFVCTDEENPSVSFYIITLIIFLKLSKKYRDRHVTKCDWLDRLTSREIELVYEQEKRDSESMYLMVEFPKIHYEGVTFTMVYFEKVCDYMLAL